MSNYIINLSDGIGYSKPIVNQFSSEFDSVRFVLDMQKDLSAYSFALVASVCGECFMLTEDGQKLIRGTEESTGRLYLDWSVGTEVTASDGVVIYQIIAYTSEDDGSLKSMWYSPEGRLVVGESLVLTEYETAQIGANPSVVMQILSQLNDTRLTVDELTEAANSHRTAQVLDHPDGSVTKTKLSEDIVKILDASIGKDYVDGEIIRVRAAMEAVSGAVSAQELRVDEISALADANRAEAESLREEMTDIQSAVRENNINIAIVDDKVNSNYAEIEAAKKDISANARKAEENSKAIYDSAIVCTASGEAINITDSSDNNLRGIALCGRTDQVTTRGKNKFYFSSDTTYTASGITYYSNTNESVFCVSGKATEDFSVSAPIGKLSAGTYTISMRGLAGTHDYVYLKNISTDSVVVDTLKAEKSTVFTVTEESEFELGAVILASSKQTYSNKKVCIQIEKGSTATVYEPYSGGYASPSPGYPQTFNNAASDGSICTDIVHKNHFDADMFVQLVKSYDSSAEELVVDGRNCIKFDIFRLYKKDFSQAINFDKSKNYTWSMDIKFYKKYSTSSNSDAYLGIGFLYNDELADETNIGNTISGVMISSRCINNSMYNFEQFGKVSITSATGVPFNGIAFLYNDRGYWLIDLDSIQLEEGSVVTDYEPYVKQSLTLSTPNGLPGVPVSSGGNYTDSSGQQWICDEIDLEKGVYIKRVKESAVPVFWGVVDVANYEGVEFYLGFFPYETYAPGGGLCETSSYTEYYDTFPMRDNTFTFAPAGDYYELTFAGIASSEEEFRAMHEGRKILMILPEAEEIPLDDEEAEALGKLHTYKPVTNIFNNAGAYMKAKYEADPKNYIDGKFRALEEAVTNINAQLL